MTDIDNKTATVREFLTWLNDQYVEQDEKCTFVHVDASWVDRWADAAFIECDTAAGFGKGHQSTAVCDNPYPDHTNHYSRSYGIEWTNEDITEQTHTKYRYENPEGTPEGERLPFDKMIRTPVKTYRLAFSDEGWY